jgi:hypothetical protein
MSFEIIPTSSEIRKKNLTLGSGRRYFEFYSWCWKNNRWALKGKTRLKFYRSPNALGREKIMSTQERNKSDYDVHNNKPDWFGSIYMDHFPYLHECQQ